MHGSRPTAMLRTVLALGAQRPASGFFAAWRHTAEGRVAAVREDNAAARDAFLATGRRLCELLMINPTVLPWRSVIDLVVNTSVMRSPS